MLYCMQWFVVKFTQFHSSSLCCCMLQSAVKLHKSLLLRLRQRATIERCTAVGQMLSPAEDTAAATDDAAADSTAASSSDSSRVSLPALLLLNFSRHPNEGVEQPEYLPALAVAVTDRPPFEPTSSRDWPQPPILMCLGADNRPMAVSGQHVVGVLRDQTMLQDVLKGQEETLAKLHAVLDDAAENKKVWANLSSRMFSCQVTFGSALTSALALKLNLPLDAFEPVGPTAETNAEIETQKQQLQEAKQTLAELRRQDKQAGQSVAEQQQALLQGVPQDALAAAVAAAGGEQPAAAAGSGSRQRSSSNNGSSSSSDDEFAAALKSLQGRDPVVVAKRLAKRARKMMAEADQGQNVTTWNSFMVGHVFPGCELSLARAAWLCVTVLHVHFLQCGSCRFCCSLHCLVIDTKNDFAHPAAGQHCCWSNFAMLLCRMFWASQ
jgi:hypothetical protein